MKIYIQLLFIFGFSLLGEALTSIFKLSIPGPIIGMILLFLAFEFKLLKVNDVSTVGDFLLNNMTILFLPAGVGILDKWAMISNYWVQILIIIVFALFINIGLLGQLIQFIKVKFEGDYVTPKLTSVQLALDVINQHSRNKHHDQTNEKVSWLRSLIEGGNTHKN